MLRLWFCLLLAATSISAAAQEVDDVLIKTGFITGTQFRSFSDPDRRSYSMGVLDGMFLSPFFGASKEQLRWLETCVTGMNDEQVAALLLKYVNDNPGRWHESMHVLAFAAMQDACRR